MEYHNVTNKVSRSMLWVWKKDFLHREINQRESRNIQAVEGTYGMLRWGRKTNEREIKLPQVPN